MKYDIGFSLNLRKDVIGEVLLGKRDVRLCIDSIKFYWIDATSREGKDIAYGDIFGGSIVPVSCGYVDSCTIKWLCRGCEKNCEGSGDVSRFSPSYVEAGVPMVFSDVEISGVPCGE